MRQKYTYGFPHTCVTVWLTWNTILLHVIQYSDIYIYMYIYIKQIILVYGIWYDMMLSFNRAIESASALKLMRGCGGGGDEWKFSK